jgi:uncharacterized protein YcfJ
VLVEDTMNKQLLTGVGIGIVVAGTIAAVASYRSSAPEAATAVSALPLVSNLATSAAPAAEQAATTPVAASSTVSKSAKPPAERYAVVLASSPVVVTDKVAREQCKDVQVTRQKPIKDEDKVAGTAIGAVVGGVLGNQIGGGDGKKIATVAGAVAGGLAGRKVQERMQEKNTETVTERQCQTVYDTTRRTEGYRVKYELDGTVRTVQMKTDPGVGTRIPARDNRLAAR